MNDTEKFKETVPRPDNKELFEYLEILYLQVLDGEAHRIDAIQDGKQISVYRIGHYIRIDITPEKKHNT